MIRTVLFDFGETLVERVVDDVVPLSDLSITAFADAAPALDELVAGGCRLAVVSNTTQSSESHMRTALRSVGLERYFHAVVTSYDVGCDKPAPAIFEQALDRVGGHPGEAAMVGNDLVADVGGAAALGLTTVHVARHSAPVAPGDVVPTFTVASLLEVPALLLSAPGRW